LSKKSSDAGPWREAVEAKRAHRTDNDTLIERIERDLDAGAVDQETVETLITRLANRADIGMHGRMIRDHSIDSDYQSRVRDTPDSRRDRYTISPYHLPSVNAVIAAIWRHDPTGEPWVLVGRRHEIWDDPTSGPGRLAVLPGGFMDPLPREGAPKDIPFDRDLIETARREIREETTLEIEREQLTQIGTRVGTYDWPKTRFQMVFADHLADMGHGTTPPAAVGCDDVAEAVWIPARDLHYIPMSHVPEGEELWTESRYGFSYKGEDCILLDEHGDVMDAALRLYRDRELEAQVGLDSASLTAMARRMETAQGMEKFSLLPRAPHTEMGPEGVQRHAQLMAFGHELNRRLATEPPARAPTAAQAPSTPRMSP